MGSNTTNTPRSDATEQETTDKNELNDDEIIVVMDGYGGDWTPTAALRDWGEATELKSLLSEDAPAVCSVTQWYDTEHDVRNGITTPIPDDMPSEICVCFEQDTALAVSDDDWVTREMQSAKGGVRGTVRVYESAEAVAADNPTVLGRFIDAADTPTEDIIDSLR